MNKKYDFTGIFGFGMFFMYFSVYVMSNANTTFEASESPTKHFVMVAAGVLSVILLPIQSLRSLLIFSPLAIIYMLGNLAAYAVMVFVFALSLPLLARGVQLLVERRRIDVVLLMALVSLAPAFLATLASEFDAIYSSSHYGRPRLLLGYWHPKEAATSLAVPIFIYVMIRGRDLSHRSMVLFPAFMWVVGSRNMALTMFLAMSMRFFPRLVFSTICVTLVGLIIFLLMSSNSFVLLDELTSLRLTAWSGVLSEAVQVLSTDLIGGERLSTDSYYVEILLSSGYVGLFLFSFWIIFFYIRYIRPFQRDSWSRALFISILFFAAFDSGIVSTGNIFHIFAWALICMPFLTGKLHKQRFPKLLRYNQPPSIFI